MADISKGEEHLDLNQKLQQLRKQKGWTQEELAELLFVSRTAVSKMGIRAWLSQH
ncbi:helix-turn-helix transcriptional regulator [Eubacteriales bacterium OttesenSCG-928-A19]|nr:helix-turn-helix transcriptional regulator [Eubacteriales bacterium OttesenSCG-928-A19]